NSLPRLHILLITTSVLPRLFAFFSFFLLLPPPPSSTLFPYTTLFRSQLNLPPDGAMTVLEIPRKGGAILSQVRVVSTVWEGENVDRKSTRLNSSHSQISYAVFCLKKKKNKIQPKYGKSLEHLTKTHYPSDTTIVSAPSSSFPCCRLYQLFTPTLSLPYRRNV